MLLPSVGIDWRALFVPTVGIPELIVRGTLMYLAIFAAFRTFPRVAGAIGIADLLLVVLVADAAQNAMASGYKSLTEGAVLVGTIIFWNYALDYMGYRIPALRRFLQPQAIRLIDNGKVIHRNLRANLITMAELREQLREHGIEEVAHVKRACLESDGRISVIKEDRRDAKHSEDQVPVQRPAR
ncbi:MAG TPA: YetF domain-containing protein [Gemmatimonadaceae bacterium]|nr:YetF domain-containing protein [Gemmatimonadaceae bacterium]